MSDPDAGLDSLAAIFPAHSRARLKRLLDASRGSVERATLALLDKGGLDGAVVTAAAPDRKRKRPGPGQDGGVREASLSGWLRPGTSRSPPGSPSKHAKTKLEQRRVLDPIELSDSDDEPPAPAAPLPDAFAKLRAPPPLTAVQASQPAALAPLTLATPAMVAKHTDGLCTLITDFLSRDLAGRLFARMVQESRGEGECPACKCPLSPFAVAGSGPGSLVSGARRADAMVIGNGQGTRRDSTFLTGRSSRPTRRRSTSSASWPRTARAGPPRSTAAGSRR